MALPYEAKHEPAGQLLGQRAHGKAVPLLEVRMDTKHWIQHVQRSTARHQLLPDDALQLAETTSIQFSNSWLLRSVAHWRISSGDTTFVRASIKANPEDRASGIAARFSISCQVTDKGALTTTFCPFATAVAAKDASIIPLPAPLASAKTIFFLLTACQVDSASGRRAE